MRNLLPALWIACMLAALLLAADAVAVDGDYSAPYASQWDTRSRGISISTPTLLGMLLLSVNAVIAVVSLLRRRRVRE